MFSHLTSTQLHQKIENEIQENSSSTKAVYLLNTHIQFTDSEESKKKLISQLMRLSLSDLRTLELDEKNLSNYSLQCITEVLLSKNEKVLIWAISIDGTTQIQNLNRIQVAEKLEKLGTNQVLIWRQGYRDWKKMEANTFSRATELGIPYHKWRGIVAGVFRLIWLFYWFIVLIYALFDNKEMLIVSGLTMIGLSIVTAIGMFTKKRWAFVSSAILSVIGIIVSLRAINEVNEEIFTSIAIVYFVIELLVLIFVVKPAIKQLK